MRFSLKKLIREFDDFGHPVGLTYKGEDSHQSVLGGAFTIVVTAFTFMLVLIKVDQVFSMSDPTITIFPKPLGMEKREELGNISFREAKFNIGYTIRVGGPTTNESNQWSLPPEVGYI